MTTRSDGMVARSGPSGAVAPAQLELQLQTEARLWAARLGLPALAQSVTVRWHRRLRTTAGLAQPKHSAILLNPRLLAWPDELARTFLHELAHLVAFARNARRRIAPHGPEWRQACADLGLAGEKRCHTMPLAAPRRLARKHFYHCPHCRREIARTRPFRRQEACLSCCRLQAGGRYDRRFRLLPGRASNAAVCQFQTELFQL